MQSQTNSGQQVLANAQLILEDEVVVGSVSYADGTITDISQGSEIGTGAIDCEGDFLSSGLVELHTDNLERHLQPRPGVAWPQKAAVLSHDAELASVGITTVFDALRVGSLLSGKKRKHGQYARSVANEILALHNTSNLRANHYLHLRSEICSETLIEELSAFGQGERIGIVSLMDHTPGFKQCRDVDRHREYISGKYGMNDAELDEHFEYLLDIKAKFGALHEGEAAKIGQEIGAVLASHDDTTLEDVAQSVKKSVAIAEFPTTFEAADACHKAGISVMMGAPNLLRGGSHSGNVAASELWQAGLLDILSSDYAPSSLLMAAVQLGHETGNMARGLKTVTSKPAMTAGLTDRGRLEIGKRADLVRFKCVGQLPAIRGVWVAGRRVG